MGIYGYFSPPSTPNYSNLTQAAFLIFHTHKAHGYDMGINGCTHIPWYIKASLQTQVYSSQLRASNNLIPMLNIQNFRDIYAQAIHY